MSHTFVRNESAVFTFSKIIPTLKCNHFFFKAVSNWLNEAKFHLRASEQSVMRN